jgi:phage-related protein/uncharacterized protein YoxC
MATERELNLLIRARDEASKVIKQNKRAFDDLEGSIETMGKVSSKTFNKMPDQLNAIVDELKKTSVEFKTIANETKGFSSENRLLVNELRESIDEIKGVSSGLEGMGDELRSTSKEMQQMGDTTSRITKQNRKEFYELEKSIDQMGKVSMDRLDKLPEHLKPISQDLRKTSMEFRELGRTAGTIDELSDSLQKTGIAAKGLTSISNSGRSGIKTMQDLAKVTKKAELAALGLSENGDIRLTTEEARAALDRYQAELKDTQKSLEGLRDAGNFGAYSAGMAEMERSTMRVNRAMAAAGQGGIAYYKTLQQLGVYSSNTADFMAVSMEGYRDRFIQSVDMMTQRSTQGEKIQKNFERMGRPLQGVTGYLNGISSNLEMMARRGTPAALALAELGPTASMKELRDQMQLINRGLARMQMLSMVSGIAFLGMNYALAKMSNIVDGRLGPAFERFKETWLDALTPFIKAWTTVMVAILNGATYIGELYKAFSETYPMLSKMVGMFFLLGTALLFFMSPLAIGISRAGGLAAAFKVLWGMIGPLVQGFLAVAGYAAALAAAIVILGAVMVKLWTNSEKLRDSIVNGWNLIKSTVMAALAPLIPKFEQLKTAFLTMVSTFTGGGNTLNSIWQAIGDKVAVVVNWIVAQTLPILKAALSVFVQVVSALIDGLIFVFGKITAWWQANSTVINGFLEMAKQIFLSVFGAIKSFILQVMPEVQNTIKMAVELIKSIFEFAMPIISKVVTVAFGIVQKVMTVLWPIVVSIIKSAWENIKSVVTSGIALIQNVIQLFQNLLQGNWKAAWENVKNILSNAVTFLWNALQLFFLGKMVSSIKSFISIFTSGIRSMWTTIKTAFSTALTNIKTSLQTSWNLFTSTIKTSMSNIVNAIKSGWSNILNSVKSTLAALWSGVQSIFSAIRAGASSFVSGVKSLLSGGFQAAKNLVINAMRALYTGITSVFSTIRSSISSLKDTILSSFRSINLLSIGKDIIRGLLNGIGSMAGAVMEKAASIANSVKNTIKDALNINSPSRVMMELGRWTSEGLADGIGKAAILAKRAAANMAEGVIKPVQGIRTPVNRAGVRSGAAAGGSGGSPVTVIFQEGAFKNAFPGVTKGEEVTKAISGISLKQAFKAQ